LAYFVAICARNQTLRQNDSARNDGWILSGNWREFDEAAACLESVNHALMIP
jgi:hypothetical protein